MIKILVDAHYVDDFYSGASTYLKGLFNELVKFDDLEIHLAARNIERLKDNFPDPRFRYIQLSSGSNIKRLLFEFPRLIKKGKFDYAHFTYFVPFIKNCKFLVSIHDLLFIDFPKYFSLKYRIGRTLMFYLSAQMADELLTISNYSKNSLIKNFRLKADKIHITPCATINIYKEKEKSERLIKENYLLYVSRIEHRKNHIALLKAFVNLKLYDNYFLIFIGAKSGKIQVLSDYIESLPQNIRAKFIHIKNVTEAEMQNYYQNASLFVFPSLGEGFGIPPLEALAAGTKVICSNATAMEDFDFLKGYQFDPTNQEELQTSIINTLQDNSYPFAKILEMMEMKYSWETAAKELHLRLIA